MASPSAAPDISLSEHFHRLKRTALLFCAAIIITVVPGVNFDKATTTIWAPFAGVSHSTVVALLWLGATYYVAGFVGEFLAAHRVNADLLLDSSGRSLRDVFQHIEKELKARLTLIEKSTLDFDGFDPRSAHDGLLEDITAHVERNITARRPEDIKAAGSVSLDGVNAAMRALQAPSEQKAAVALAHRQYTRALQDQAANAIAAGMRHQLSMLRSPAQPIRGPLGPRIESMLSELRQERMSLEGLTRTLPALGDRLNAFKIYGVARTMMFWAWKFSAVAIMYAVATLIFVYHVPDMFGMEWVKW